MFGGLGFRVQYTKVMQGFCSSNSTTKAQACDPIV